MFDFVVVTFLPESATLISLAYYSICVLLNTILTSLICYPIIRYGKLIRTELGHEHSAVYFAVAEIIVESALPFTLSGIAFLVALGVRSYAVTPLSWVYFMMTVGNCPIHYTKCENFIGLMLSYGSVFHRRCSSFGYRSEESCGKKRTPLPLRG